MKTNSEIKFTVEELAKKLKVSKKTILREIKRGKLRSQRIGRRHIIPEGSLEAYLGRSSGETRNLLTDFLKSKKSEMISLLQRMVSTPSISNEFGTEAKLAHLIKRKLNDWGIRSVIYNDGTTVAVRATYGYAAQGILLDCPLDTLPAGQITKWTFPPFEGVINKGRMYGRGTADSKAGICAMLYTVLMLKQFVDEEKIRVELVFDGGEQDGMFSGMRRVLEKGLGVSSGIIGYSGDWNDVLVGARGYHRYQFETKGQSVHTGSRFKPGINAISKMVDFIKAVEGLKLPGSSNPLFSFGSRLTFSQIEGGRAINMVPDSCVAKLDVRVTPEMKKANLEEKITGIINSLKKKDKDFEISFEYITGQEAYVLERHEKLAESLVSSIRNGLGKDVVLTASGPAHVGNLLNEYGIPMVVWGPKGEGAHSYNEYVEIDSIPVTSEVYFKTICSYFSLTEGDLNPKTDS